MNKNRSRFLITYSKKNVYNIELMAITLFNNHELKNVLFIIYLFPRLNKKKLNPCNLL